VKLDRESSERLALIRFPLIVGVVFAHIYGSTVDFADGAIGLAQPSVVSTFIRNLISLGIAKIAVPAFCFIAGFLFFNQLKWSKDAYLKKVNSRVKTLVVPFLFWNLLFLLLLAIAQTIPLTSIYFSPKNAPISSYGMFDFIDAVIGLTRTPIAYQFWFIRDLIILIVFAPLIHEMIKKAPFIFLFLFVALWFFELWPFYFPQARTVCFFYMGSLVAIKSYNIFSLDKYGKPISTLYVFVVILDALTKGEWFNYQLHQIGVVLGLGSVLFFTKILAKNENIKAVFLWLSGTGFFIYVFHEPLLTTIVKISYRFIHPLTDTQILTIYFFAPVVVIAISIIIFVFLRKTFPKATKVVVGGRV